MVTMERIRTLGMVLCRECGIWYLPSLAASHRLTLRHISNGRRLG